MQTCILGYPGSARDQEVEPVTPGRGTGGGVRRAADGLGGPRPLPAASRAGRLRLLIRELGVK